MKNPTSADASGAAIVLTPDGRPLYANATGRGSVVGGALNLPLRHECRAIGERRLRQVLADFSAGGSTAAMHLPGEPCLLVLLSRLEIVAQGDAASAEELPASLILARLLPTTLRLPPRDVLKALFSMSDAEVEISLLMAEGITAREAAQRRGVTVATVRSQVQSVLEKAGVTSQKELIALLSSLA